MLIKITLFEQGQDPIVAMTDAATLDMGQVASDIEVNISVTEPAAGASVTVPLQVLSALMAAATNGLYERRERLNSLKGPTLVGFNKDLN